MASLNKRIISGTLAFAMVFVLAACDSDDPSETTQPGETETTAPVGS